MSRIFNVNANCLPELHYMVDITERLKKIKVMIDAGQYFTINRARQYGKTTTLRALKNFLEKDYMVVSVDFQLMSASKFISERTFSAAFAKQFVRAMESESSGTKDIAPLQSLKTALQKNAKDIELPELFEYLSDICAALKKPMVLMIDEIDSILDNQVFLDFLAQLRGYYINRDIVPTFQSVILAGIHDIRNIKRKLRSEKEHKFNSPWNIAADFLVDMSFSAEDIAGMLIDYEKDYHIGMDIEEFSHLISDYTSGYPFLVSRICKLIDERIAGSREFPDKKQAWTKTGFLKAIRMLLTEANPLFESLLNKLEDYPELDKMLRDLLFKGKEISYVPGVDSVETALMFGLVKIQDYQVQIANRIFETLLYNFFLAVPAIQQEELYDAALMDKNQFMKNGHLDMKLILERFVLHFDELYGDRGERFYEEDERRYFMLYLRPFINGSGNYYIEAETRNRERTDLIVDYQGEQFVIEIKIWHGMAYHTRGEKQLSDYLEYYHLKKGYMLSFNFNKMKEIGVKEIVLGDKILVEAVV